MCAELNFFLTMAHTLTSNGALLVLMKLALDKAQHQAGLAHGRLSKQDQLKLAYFAADGGGTVGPRWSTSPRHADRPDTVEMRADWIWEGRRSWTGFNWAQRKTGWRGRKERENQAEKGKGWERWRDDPRWMNKPGEKAEKKGDQQNTMRRYK